MTEVTRTKKLLRVGFMLTFLYGLQLSLLAYVLSDYLSQYISEQYISLTYFASAIFSLYVLNTYNNFLHQYNNYRTTSTLLLLQIFTLGFMSIVTNVYLVAFYTIIYLAITILLNTSLNLYIDEWSDHNDIGMIRGINTVILALSLITGLFLSKLVLLIDLPMATIVNSKYANLILANIIILAIMHLLIKHYYSNLKEPRYASGNMWRVLLQLHRNKDLYGVFIANLALQTYTAIMISYFVIYLTQNNFIMIADYVGYIMPLALLAFVFIPYKVGYLADKKYGEKEFMIIGLIIISISMLLLPVLAQFNLHIIESNMNYLSLLNTEFFQKISSGMVPTGIAEKLNTINTHLYPQLVFSWGILLLIGRVGSSILETASNSYFYKKVSKSDNDSISLFSNMGSIGTLIASLLAFIAYNLNTYLNINYALFILGPIFFLFTIHYVWRIKDTK